MKSLKVILTVLISLVLLSSSFEVIASNSSGTCGPGISWKFDNGVVTVSGNGAIYNYDDDYSYSPFVKFNDDIKKIVIKPGITHIGNYTFWGCINVTELSLPNTLISIGDGAFESCINLTTVKIPDSVKTIGNEAFGNCTGIKNLSLGNGVETIGSRAFSMYSQITTLVIPDSVKTIGSHAFNLSTKLTKLVIGNGVTSVGYRAFADCQSIETLVLGSKIETIEKEAFQGCEKLKSLTLPAGVKSIGESAFEGCSSLTELYIPDSVTNVDSKAFRFCYGLKNVTVGSGLRELRSGLFYFCSNMESIIIPDNIKYIDMNTFELCYNITIKCYSNSYAEQYAKNNNIKIEYMDGKYIDVPENVWYFEGVSYCTDKGYITGVGNHKFDPEGNLTREQFVVILARVAETDLSEYTSTEFTDVKVNSWYGPSVIWANESGYVNGIGNGKFGVGQNIDRESLATLFYRYAEKQGIDVSEKADMGEYTDSSRISSWSMDACAWAVNAGLLSSTNTKVLTLSPQMTVTRAQAAKIFMSYDNI